MMNDLTSLFTRLVELVAEYRTTLLFFACVGLGAAGAWLIAGMAFREHLLDTPNERSSHTVPTPRGGGVGILAAFIMAGLTLRIPTTFLFAAILISAVSFYGDYIRISVKFRLVFQVLSALMFLFPLLPRLSAQYSLSGFGVSPFLFLLILLTIFIFLIGTANFYNFMDGINGIAGLSGVIGFGLLGLYTLYRPNPGPLSNAVVAAFDLHCPGLRWLSSVQHAPGEGLHGRCGQYPPGIRVRRPGGDACPELSGDGLFCRAAFSLLRR